MNFNWLDLNIKRLLNSRLANVYPYLVNVDVKSIKIITQIYISLFIIRKKKKKKPQQFIIFKKKKL